MKQLASIVVLPVWILMVAGACGKPADQPPARETAPAAGTIPASGSQGRPIAISFKSEPDPPRPGENAFEVAVTGGDSQPATDAVVSVEFYMAAMPEMKMPEMRNTVTLPHAGDGRYRGRSNLAVAGTWDVTVTVTRGGQTLGTRKLSVTAKP